MPARSARHANQCPPGRTIASVILLLTFLWAFLGTIDGPAVNFGINAGSLVYKTAKVPDREPGAEPRLYWIGVFPEEPPPVHASFLLFDFKQNLRRWPNVAGDMNRSPPLFLA